MIRVAKTSDAAEIVRVYAPAVTDGVISFETVVPSVEEMTNRIEQTLVRYPWLVDEVDEQSGRLRGFAYATAYRSRQAYQWSVEVSIYVDEAQRRNGCGRALYGELFKVLVELGYHVALAGIAVPNAASRHMHEAMGFESAGILRGIGYKQGDWRDVGWWVKRLVPDSEQPPKVPIAFSQWQQPS